MAVLLVAGCFQEDKTGGSYGLLNDTAITIVISQVVDGEDRVVVTLSPWQESGWVFDMQQTAGGERCTDLDLVLRDDAGTELGRIPPPLCVGVPTIYLSQIVPTLPKAP